MVRAIVDHGANARERIARDNAVLHGLLNALVDRGNQRTRDASAHHLVAELIALARTIGTKERLDAQPAVAILTGTARLLFMAPLSARDAANRLAVRNANGHDMRHDLGAILKTVEQHRYLSLAHRRDDGLARLVIALDAHGGIGLARLLDKAVELLLVAAILGLDGYTVLRVGELERRGLHLTGDAQRITRLGRQLRRHDDIACIGMADFAHLAPAHHVEMRQTLTLARARVDQLKTGLKCARQHFQEADTTLLRVGECLEHKRHGALIVGADLERITIDKRHLTVIRRCREVSGNVIHQRIDALLFEAIARKDRHEDALGDSAR